MILCLLTGRISTRGSHSSGYTLPSPSHKQRRPHPISPSAFSGALRWALSVTRRAGAGSPRLIRYYSTAGLQNKRVINVASRTAKPGVTATKTNTQTAARITRARSQERNGIFRKSPSTTVSKVGPTRGPRDPRQL